MKYDFKEYFIDSDSLCFTLYKKGISKNKKPTLSVVGYFGTFPQTINALGKRITLENDDIETVMEKLDDIERQTLEISKKLNLRVRIVE